MDERIAAKMNHPIGKTAASREVRCDGVKVGLKLERSDMAPDGVSQVARRSADAGADIEDPVGGPKTEPARGVTDRVGAVIVPLVQGKELLGWNRIGRADAAGRQSLGDAVHVRIERH